MLEPSRRLVCAAALAVVVTAGTATAQTVIVRHAPPGSKVELVLNAATVDSTAASASGDATVSVGTSAGGKDIDMDARVFVDTCVDAKLRRVLLVEHVLSPPAIQAGCERRELTGIFWTRSISTFVLDVGSGEPKVLLRQGPAPAGWLSDAGGVGSSGARPLGSERTPPTGVVLFGGGGFTSFSDAVTPACGDVANCAADGTTGTYAVGGAFWFTRFLGAELSYVKPGEASADGSGAGYRFGSSLNTQFINIVGTLGVSAGPVRFYGRAGMNRHEVRSRSTDTIDDVAVTIDGVTQTVVGGTQTFDHSAEGWDLLYGGGIEVWPTRTFGFYGEVGRAHLEIPVLGAPVGTMEERATTFLFGGRVHIGG